MNDPNVILVLAIFAAGFLLLLWAWRQKSLKVPNASSPLNAIDSLPAAKHYAHFRQIQQALSAVDARYLKASAPPDVARRALRERHAVARGFLRGLHEDFSNLARLGRIIAALSPEVSRQQETERLMLSLKFQLLYGLVWLRLSTGNLPVQQLADLTSLVGRLAKRMDEAMAEISALSAGQLSGNA